MKDAISYLKIDLRISRKTLLMIMPALIFMGYMFFAKEFYIMGMSYLLLFLVICVNVPFTAQGNENLECLYYTFPTKISKMVLGRFIYLIMWYIVIFSIEAILMMYLSSINKINNIEIIIIYLCEMITAIMCFFEYIICYRLGIKKSSIMSFIYFIPGMIMLMIPSFLIDKNNIIYKQVNFIINNKNLITIFSGFAIIIIGYVSYLISCRICRKKEV